MIDRVLDMRGISLNYGEIQLFSGLTSSLATGANLLVTGSNGSGKTSLLKILASQLAPTKGTFEIADNIYFPAEPTKPGFKKTREYLQLTGSAKIHSLNFIESVVLKSADKKMANLSSGEFKAIALARVLSIKRSVYLLDEPTITLDKENITGLNNAILELNSRGHSVVIATNNPEDFASLYCHEIRLG